MGVDTTTRADHPSTNALDDIEADLLSVPPAYFSLGSTPPAPDFDATTALADEAEAYRLLYSNLDAHQQSIFDDLKAAGVL
jgi:hypothetical protein